MSPNHSPKIKQRFLERQTPIGVNKTVWPDWAKLRHLCENVLLWAYFCEEFFTLGKFFWQNNLLWANFFKNLGKFLDKIYLLLGDFFQRFGRFFSNHLVTLQQNWKRGESTREVNIERTLRLFRLGSSYS